MSTAARIGMTVLLAPLIVAVTAGCAQTSLDGIRLPTEAREGKVFLVLHQPKDQRRLDLTIQRRLLAHGLNAVTYPTPSADFVVNYMDRWYWDLRTYLIDLRIDVRDTQTGVLVATARSFQTSLAAMGHSYDEIVAATVDELVQGGDMRVQRADERSELGETIESLNSKGECKRSTCKWDVGLSDGRADVKCVPRSGFCARARAGVPRPSATSLHLAELEMPELNVQKAVMR